MMRLPILKNILALIVLFFALCSAQAQSGVEVLDGNWYSAQWKYGYVLKNGVGTATSSNSPNFQVGQNILQLTATSHTTFTGRQIYTDGKFYLVQATLQADGRLYFEGEKNAKWFMERVGSAPAARATPPQASTPAIDTRFTLVNRSGETIFKLFISSVQATGWGQDVLGNDVLMTGYEQPFKPGTNRGCQFDIQVSYQSKRIEEKRNLNLCELERVIFDGRSATLPSGQSNQSSAPAPRAAPAPAPRPPASYDGSTPLRCGGNVNCRNQAEVVQKMQMRWANFSRSTHYGNTCLDAIRTIRTMHPAAYGNGNPGFVQPQMDICNLR